MISINDDNIDIWKISIKNIILLQYWWYIIKLDANVYFINYLLLLYDWYLLRYDHFNYVVFCQKFFLTGRRLPYKVSTFPDTLIWALHAINILLQPLVFSHSFVASFYMTMSAQCHTSWCLTLGLSNIC